MANSLLFSLLMKMDAGQAKAELAALNAALSKTGGEAVKLGADANRSAAGIKKVGDEARAAAEAAKRLKKEQQEAEHAAQELLRVRGRQAQTTGNLVAQFNDIGMMIAAGQNPLQLAIQQGTQISQVIGPMGATGAVKALGGAFMGMLNPMNFVTLAVIAGGAAFAQWAMSGGEAAKSFEDHLKDIADALTAIESYDTADLFSGMSVHAKTIRSEFETILGVVQQVEAASLQASLREMKTANPLAKAVAEYQGDASVLAQIGAPAPDFNAMGLDSLYQAQFVLASIAEIQGQTREELLKSLDAAAERITLIGYMTPEVQQQLALIAEQLGLEKEINEERRTAVASAKELTSTREKDRETAAEILADLQAEAELNATAALYGEQSAEATALRAEQEREAFVEMVKSLDVTDQMRLAMMVAYDNAQALAGVDFATGIGLGADEALRMGDNIVAAANAWLEARSLANQPERLAMTKYGSRGTVSNRPIEDGEGEVIRIKSSTRGARGGGAAKEADSVAKLIEKLQGELDISRELDPVQQEMARYRDQLAKATDGEREKVETLIATRIREKAAMESLSYVGEQTGNALIDGLMGAADAGEQLIDTLMRAALQAVILGKGPLANILGGGGGLLGGLFSGLGGGAQGGVFDLFGGGALIGGLADGGGVGDGMIYGAGGPRDDLVPFWGSAGEFVVNARATHRHRALLEQINSGQLDSAPAFANGGTIGGGAGGVGGGGLGGGTVFNAYFDLSGAQGDDAVQAAAKRGMDAALREFARTELLSQVRRISADPSVMRF